LKTKAPFPSHTGRTKKSRLPKEAAEVEPDV